MIIRVDDRDRPFGIGVMNILMTFNARCIISVITNVRVFISAYMHSLIEGSDVGWDGGFIWDL